MSEISGEMDEVAVPQVEIKTDSTIDQLRRKLLSRFTTEREPGRLHPEATKISRREYDSFLSLTPSEVVSPNKAAYEFTAEDWSAWLVNNVPIFSEEKEIIQTDAGILMADFVSGVNYIYEEHRKRGNRFPRRPKIGIRGDEEMLAREGNIEIGQQSLLQLTGLPIDEPRPQYHNRASRRFNLPLFYGTAREFITSVGVHEGDHVQLEQADPNRYREIIENQQNSNIRTFIEYNAQEHELRALGEQLQHAYVTGMRQETILHLQNKIKAAEECRSDQLRRELRS